MQNLRPSLNLLSTSLLVSVSGMCRIHIALLLVGGTWPLAVYLGGGLGVYATYTLDRALDAEEDQVNREALSGSRREVGVVASVLAFLLACFLLADSGLWWVILLPSLIGYLYSKGVPVPGRGVLRLKGDLGVKNLVVGSTWATYVALFATGAGTGLVALLAIGLFFFGKSVVNSAIYDFRDVPGDVAAGIRTIPVVLGPRLARVLLLNIHLQAHLVAALAVVTGVVRPLPVVLGSTLLIGVAYIHLYGRVPRDRSSGRGRQLLVNGEFVHAELLRRAASLL